MVDLSTLVGQALPLEDWYSFTIALPEGLDPGGARSLEVVPKKRYDAVEHALNIAKNGGEWLEREMITNHKVVISQWLFVRCKNGFITSGHFLEDTWFVYDPVTDTVHKEIEGNPVTHYCLQPLVHPWSHAK